MLFNVPLSVILPLAPRCYSTFAGMLLSFVYLTAYWSSACLHIKFTFNFTVIFFNELTSESGQVSVTFLAWRARVLGHRKLAFAC